MCRRATDAQRGAAARRHGADVVDAGDHEHRVAVLGDSDRLIGTRILRVALVDDEPEGGRERVDRGRAVAVARALAARQRDAEVGAPDRVDALVGELARGREQRPGIARRVGREEVQAPAGVVVVIPLVEKDDFLGVARQRGRLAGLAGRADAGGRAAGVGVHRLAAVAGVEGDGLAGAVGIDDRHARVGIRHRGHAAHGAADAAGQRRTGVALATDLDARPGGGLARPGVGDGHADVGGREARARGPREILDADVAGRAGVLDLDPRDARGAALAEFVHVELADALDGLEQRGRRPGREHVLRVDADDRAVLGFLGFAATAAAAGVERHGDLGRTLVGAGHVERELVVAGGRDGDREVLRAVAATEREGRTERHGRRVLGAAAVRGARPARVGHLELVVARLDRDRDREDVVRDFLQLVLGQHGPVTGDAAAHVHRRVERRVHLLRATRQQRGLLCARAGPPRRRRVVVLGRELDRIGGGAEVDDAGLAGRNDPGAVALGLAAREPRVDRRRADHEVIRGRLEVERFRHRDGRRRRDDRRALIEVGRTTAAAATAREQRGREKGGRGKLQQVSERARHGHTPGHAAELETPAGAPTCRLATADGDAGCASLMDSWSITSKRERSPVSSDDQVLSAAVLILLRARTLRDDATKPPS